MKNTAVKLQQQLNNAVKENDTATIYFCGFTAKVLFHQAQLRDENEETLGKLDYTKTWSAIYLIGA